MLKKFLKDENGYFSLWVALAAVPMIGVIAMSIDTTNMSRQGSQLQQSVDSALLEIATQYDPNQTATDTDVAGTKFFDTNLLSAGLSGTNLNYLGSTVDADGNVTLRAEGTKPFSGDISALLDDTLLRKSAVVRQKGDPACLLALSPTASNAIDLSGTTDVSLTGCVLAANSTAADSVDRSGSANLTAACVQTVGGTVGIINDSNTDLTCDGARENSYRTADPLANLVPPSDVGCNQMVLKGGKSLQKVDANIYCNNALKVNGGERLQFNSGTYIFKGTSISVLGGGELKGSDVSIFLYDGASLTVAANAIFDIKAPTTGTYAGIAIYSEPGNPVEIKLNGGSTQSIQGFIYNPKGTVKLSGNSSTESAKCIRIIADTMVMTGTSQLKADCTTELGGKEITTVQQIRLVN